MIDYLNSIRTESERFGRLIAELPASTPVPSCPEWSVADLTWHLAEVQYFWASIVAGLLDSPRSVVDLERPGDEALPRLFEQQSGFLLKALASRQPGDVCWSWHNSGHSVGWVLRRQAHEALIHRVDAELAQGGAFAVDPDLAADGVDEVLTVMLNAADLPDWATFHPAGTTVEVRLAHNPVSWAMELGTFTGTSPATGNNYDDPALRLLPALEEPTAVITAAATDLDLWLWGRGSDDAIEIIGPDDIGDRVRAIAAAGTQ